MLTTMPFLQAGRRDDALADDRERAVAADLADEGDDLRRPDVDPDEDRFHSRSTLVVRRPAAGLQEVTADEGHVLEDPQPEGDQGHEVEVEAEPIADEGEEDGHERVGDEAR